MIAVPNTLDHQSRSPDLLVALSDLRNLAWMHKHTLDFRTLIRASEPTTEPLIGASAGADAWQNRRKVARREANQWIISIEGRDDHFPDLTHRNGLTRARPNDLDQDTFVDYQTFAR